MERDDGLGIRFWAFGFAVEPVTAVDSKVNTKLF
jgi:hypothetical protein